MNGKNQYKFDLVIFEEYNYKVKKIQFDILFIFPKLNFC